MNAPVFVLALPSTWKSGLYIVPDVETGPITVALVAAAMASCASAAAAPRTSPASRREALNGLILLIDVDKRDTALYRDTYRVVVDGCGRQTPIRKRPANEPPPGNADRTTCSAFAAALIDLIEDDKMNTPAFVPARNRFARACPPH